MQPPSLNYQDVPSSPKGSWASLLLPINTDQSIDYNLLATEIDILISAGVDGIYSNGSAGEFYAQSESEFDRVSELLAERCVEADMPFQIGASHMSPQTSLGRLRRIKALRPSGIQIVLPDWFVPSWREIIEFLRVFADEAAPVPIILYNPPHAKRVLMPMEWLEITKHVPGIVGAKVAGGDVSWYEAMQPVFEKISVFIPGHMLATGLARGAHGTYSNVACLSPRGAQRWYELCGKDPDAGQHWQKSILAFWQEHIAPLVTKQGLCNMAADKAAAAAGGWLPGFTPRLRWPYRSANASMLKEIGNAAKVALPHFFSA